MCAVVRTFPNKSQCDEQRPQCTPCKKRKIRCSFTDSEETESSVQPSNALVPACGLNHTDLRLMHHFATSAAVSLAQGRPGMEDILRTDIPALAFQNDYLMHCILGIASLHIEYVSPKNPLHNPKAVFLHRGHAIAGFRKAIANISPANSNAILVTSLFLLMLGSADFPAPGTVGGGLWITNWLGLHAGIRAIIDQVGWQHVQGSSVAPVFSRGKEPFIVPAKLPLYLWDMLAGIDMSGPFSQTLSRALHALGSLYSILLSEGITYELFLKVSSWPASLPPDFTVAAKNLMPEALVILAFYLSFAKMLVGGGWWLNGIADQGIQAIESLLEPSWQYLMELPLMVLKTADKEDIKTLLLSQLPKDTTHDLERGAVYEMPAGSKAFDPQFSTPP
jgi:hypothetical protein